LISGLDLVQARSLSLTYGGETRALAEVDFTIPQGQFVSIVGPSGCGKSTLLRIIAGLVPPTAGEITVGGSAPRIARKQQTRVSFVFQDATLLPWRTVSANIGLPLELEHASRDQRDTLTRDAAQRVGLADFARHFPDELSGGMRMRVSLARALVTNPELLLLDEPFAALDDITRQMLNEELMRLWAGRGWTGIFVTHNIAEAVFLSQRILVMSARPGRIVADVPVKFETPRSPALRSQPEFGRLVGKVTEYLRKGSA